MSAKVTQATEDFRKQIHFKPDVADVGYLQFLAERLRIKGSSLLRLALYQLYLKEQHRHETEAAAARRRAQQAAKREAALLAAERSAPSTGNDPASGGL